MLMHAYMPEGAHLCHNVLHGVGVVQHEGHGQMRAAQLVNLARKLDGRQRVAAQLVEAGAAVAHLLWIDAQCERRRLQGLQG